MVKKLNNRIAYKCCYSFIPDMIYIQDQMLHFSQFCTIHKDTALGLSTLNQHYTIHKALYHQFLQQLGTVHFLWFNTKIDKSKVLFKILTIKIQVGAEESVCVEKIKFYWKICYW